MGGYITNGEHSRVAPHATRSRAPNAHQRNQHEAGYCSRICLNNVEIRTWLEKRVLYAL